MKIILGSFLSSNILHAFSVPTSTPDVASITITALPETLTAEYTSPEKSK